jgi:alkylation response protein AidB-like acyl-CoA dehydrogenase
MEGSRPCSRHHPARRRRDVPNNNYRPEALMQPTTQRHPFEAIFARCGERAAGYDRDNRFFAEDFEELKAAGYLRMPVPRELGGLGLSLAESCRHTRNLAYHAPATALGLNMHVYWVGVAAHLWRAGDKSLEWILREAASGEVFAAGHAESGNDVPVLLSTTKAERVDGGYRFFGHKHFGSLTPVWTRFGLHGMDTSDPANPRIVHAFLPRGTPGYRVEETWDVLGMRATRSDDTILEGCVVPDRYIARILPAGSKGLDAFIASIFAWALLGFGNVYYGLARHAVDRTVETVKKKRSIGLSRSMAYHAEIQHAVAEMVIELESIGPQLEAIAQAWSENKDGSQEAVGALLRSTIAAKYHAVEGSWRIVDRALDVAGGFGIFKSGGFERMLRDARLGRLHPSNGFLAYELIAKMTLGIDPDEQPRWG